MIPLRDENPSHSTPVVTRGLIVLNVATFLYELMLGPGLKDFNFAWGVEGQKYIDRNGATLDLPMVTRWSAYGVDVVD